jgi:hypothetical protein
MSPKNFCGKILKRGPLPRDRIGPDLRAGCADEADSE